MRLAKNKFGFNFNVMRILSLFFLLWVGCGSWAQTEENPNQYSAALQEKAESGDADAQFQLGDCYFFGLGVKRDLVEGASWYRKAAEAGRVARQERRTGSS